MKKTILVADDDPAIRRLVRRALQGDQYDVIEAADGDEAIELALRTRPALVLLDLHMPRLDGLAALTEILERDASVAIVVLSGDGDSDHARLALARGGRDYLAKPIDLRQLQTTVDVNVLLARRE